VPELVWATVAAAIATAFQYWALGTGVVESLVGSGVLAFVVLIGCYVHALATIPPTDHNHLASILAKHKAGTTFAALLRGRVAELDAIPGSADAFLRMWEVQIRIVQLLRRADSTWQEAPAGWDACSASEHQQFGALMLLMRHRYPQEMPPVDTLGGMLGLLTYDAERLREVSKWCCMLVVREIDFRGTYPMQREPENFFREQCERVPQMTMC
jgi:hypothetical protein